MRYILSILFRLCGMLLLFGAICVYIGGLYTIFVEDGLPDRQLSILLSFLIISLVLYRIGLALKPMKT